MKRLIITKPRCAEFEEVEKPTCSPGEVLVEATMTAISTGTELRVYRAEPVDDDGRFLHERVPFQLPAENGYSMVGRVVEMAGDVTRLTIGRRVFVPAGHKQFAAVPASLATPLPDVVSDEQAVFLNILEVGHLALRRGEPAPGSDVAIVGQGVIGLAALAYARMFGFRTAVVDRSPTRLEIAKRMKADFAISPDEPNFTSQIREFFDCRGADLVIEAASDWSAIETAMRIACDDGVVVVAARHLDRPQFNPVGHPFLGKRLTLLTSYGHPPEGHRWDRFRAIRFTLDRLARRDLNVSPIITHRANWRELPSFYDRLDRGDLDVVGVVLDWRST